MHRTPRTWLAVVAVIAATMSAGHTAADSGAEITASFADACRDFAAHSSKDISHVVVRYADGHVVKDETINRPDFALDGGPGDEIASASVKSATTIERFECEPAGHPPAALLESRRCGFANCGDWTSVDSDGSHEQCSHFEDQIPFRGTNSTDPDGDIVSWSIDFGDGSAPVGGAWADAPPATVGHVFDSTGLQPFFTVTLTLTDSAGQAGVDTIVVCLVDFRPD